MSYGVGTQHEIDGVLYVVVALGRRVGENEWEFYEGRPLLEPDENALVIYPDEQPDSAIVLQRVEDVLERERLGNLEREIDERLDVLRKVLLPYEDEGQEVPVELVARMLRAAYARGGRDVAAGHFAVAGLLDA